MQIVHYRLMKSETTSTDWPLKWFAWNSGNASTVTLLKLLWNFTNRQRQTV